MMSYIDARLAYRDWTKRLCEDRRIHSAAFTFGVTAQEDMHAPRNLECAINKVFPRTMLRCNQEMSFSTWLVNGVFPFILYREHNEQLLRMNADPRFGSAPIYSKKDGWSSFFGRMSRPRDGLAVTYLEYMIRRMRDPLHRGMPHFYFDVEEPSWVFEPLINNLKLLKTGRTALACVMAFSFKWDNENELLHMSMIMRSNQWSHLYGDVFGGKGALIAVLRELNLPAGTVTIFSPSFVMDTPKEARALLEEWI